MVLWKWYETWNIFMNEIAKCDNWIKVSEIRIIYIYVAFKQHRDKGSRM